MEMTPLLLLLLFCAGVCSKELHGHLRPLHLSNERFIWSDAQNYCREHFTDLVTIPSVEEADILAKVLLEAYDRISVSAWIGLHNNSAAKQRWSSGHPVEFQPWSNATDLDNTTCAAVNNGVKWEDCTMLKPFLCYNDGISDSPPGYVLIKQDKSWHEARCYCRQRYTDLASIRSHSQHDQVLDTASDSSFWIGLQSENWEWSDGSAYVSRKWSKSGKQHHCVYFKAGKYSPNEMKRGDCNSNMRQAVCYQDVVEIVREERTWEEALMYCVHQHGRMLTVESEDDQRVVEQTLRTACLARPVWVGLRQSSLFGFWFWTSDQGVGWSNWVGDRSPELPLSDHCGVIDTAEGYKWRDQSCLSKHYFLCERNITGPVG